MANVSGSDRSPELPLFRVTCNDGGRVVYTHDPGRALVTGKCTDVGAIVMQQFRGLDARAPYFSNGSAATLRDVVEFYDRRFAIALTEAEKADLVNFLRVL
jgi:cytochrome c peroxidase